MNNFISISGLAISILIVNPSFSQDKVKLNDGSKHIGKITSYTPDNVSIRINEQTKKFTTSEIKKIKLQSIELGGSFKKRGYFNESSIGFQFGNSNGYYQGREMKLSFQMNNGFQFNEKFGLGLVTGLESFGEVYSIPAMVSTKYYFKNESFAPFFSLYAGYSFRLSKSNYYGGCYYPYYNYDSDFACIEPHVVQPLTIGPTTQVNLGIRRSIDKHFGYSLSVGARYQLNDTGYWVKNHLFRGEIRLGLFFN